MVKQYKKRSASSFFSNQTHAVCKCTLGVERMTCVLVAFHNVIIKNEFYSKQWLKTLDVILGKGKEMIIRKLWIITLIEGDL